MTPVSVLILVIRMAQYTTSIISYFDVLGFRALIASDQNAESVAQKLRALRRHSETDADIAQMQGSTFTNFSDLVLRTIPLHQRNGSTQEHLLFMELLDLVHIQADLIRSEVLLRGALTIGQIYASGDVTFGPGLVRAYELESTVALYPRVIIDPEVFETLRDNPALRTQSYENEVRDMLQLISQGSDGVWFIDYLRAIESELDHPADYLELLKEHRDLITSKISDVSGLDSVASKFGWLRSYHNSHIGTLDDKRLRSSGCEKKDLLVSTESEALPMLSADQT